MTNRQPLMLAVVALVGLALRPFLTGVGPLAAPISAETGLTMQGLSALTLLPILLMGAGAFLGPAIQARLGAKRAAVLALLVLGLGSGLRLGAHSALDMLGSAVLLGAGAAVVQAVFPTIIKREFPRGINLAMGLYAAMMMGGGAFGAQAAPLIAAWSGSWRLALGWLALPAALTALLVALALPPEARAPQGSRQGLWHWLRLPRVWLLMACFGLINGGYSSSVAWLAPAFQDLGWSAGASGGLLAVLAVGQAVSALATPVLASRGSDRRPWLGICLAMQALGFAMLVLHPEAAPYPIAFLLGAGLGGCFSLMMIVALDHLPDPAQAGALAALMQGGGFLLAAIPPWILALLHDLTGSFTLGWALHLAAVLAVCALALRLSPASYRGALHRPGPQRSGGAPAE
ncbi:MFS transporter [Paracoccus versutus]|uniref:CP family cyanate transporter-like MFS transporter n=2 Tax=Paracoccus versutus TaxID=34007 RepID=A0AAQ0HEI2_PARVE|nr:MFS transporter [Paracoccus versutus]KGJ07302.1 major facilitator transporter [Paracoccus versutus]REG33480.1 CP family cyanate transporter-like MFS transporter [Paracoccus versutus]SFY42045.1 MFS transporter, CP family, cyanate transporter [Paracoccus pantotrophus]